MHAGGCGVSVSTSYGLCHIFPTSPRTAQRGTKCCHWVRRIESKGAALVIVWTFLIIASVSSPAYINTLALKGLSDTATWVIVFGSATVTVTAPIAGLLASIWFGRYRALRASLWLLWIGSVVLVTLFIVQCFFEDSQLILSYSQSGCSIAVVGCYVGVTLYFVNAIQFGLDQMPAGSGEQLGAFVHWYTWSGSGGVAVAFFGYTVSSCTTLDSSEVALLQALLSSTLLTVVLSSSFLLRGWLIIEPRGKNPLKTFFGVLRFAARHKVPVRRSAFTYCETGMPSRLDLGKSKYGGPFTSEEVEDVKTCLRIVLVVVSVSVTMSAFHAYLGSISVAFHTEFIPYFSYGHTCMLNYFPEYSSGFTVLFGLPVYEVLIRPHLRNRALSTLKRVGLSQFLIVAASLFPLVATTVWYMYTDPSACMFTSRSLPSFPLNSIWIDILHNMLIWSIFQVYIIGMLELVCAQAPYILRGLLFGVVYSVLLCNIAVGLGVYTIYQEKAPNSPSCGVWFYLFTTITATLGCVLWCAVAKWYKRRERDEPDMCRIFAENYYDH